MNDRVGETLRSSLPDDDEARAELRAVITELAALQAQMAEWAELHHLLHQVLVAFGPFHACLAPSGEHSLCAAERQALLRQWLACQDRLDTLVGFAEEIARIGSPFRREGRELHGERWVVEIIALQLLLEDALKEDDLSLQSMLELAEEFNSACHRHMAVANRELRAVVDKTRRLSMCLLGGMS